MKKIMLATVAAAIVSTPAMAAPNDSESFTLGARIQLECSVEDPETVRFGRLDINEDPGADALLLAPGRYDSGQQIWSSCNYPTDITITGEPMANIDQANDGADAGDFQDFLHWRMTWRPSGAIDFLQVNHRTVNGNPSTTRTQTDAFHNDALLNTAISSDDNTLRPLAGRYRAIATVSLGAI